MPVPSGRDHIYVDHGSGACLWGGGFFRKLGAQGYQDFKVQVSISQARVGAILEAHADDRMGVEHRPEPEAAAGQTDWVQKVFLAHRKALHETMLLVDECNLTEYLTKKTF